jgi:hypothetical protein
MQAAIALFLLVIVPGAFMVFIQRLQSKLKSAEQKVQEDKIREVLKDAKNELDKMGAEDVARLANSLYPGDGKRSDDN